MIAFVLLLAGCAGPTLPPRVVEEADPLALIESIAPPDGAELDVAITILANDATAALRDEPLAIDVYRPADLSPDGFPMLHRRPVARHVHAQPVDWPVSTVVSVAAVAGARVIAWVDVDRSGGLSPGDRVGDAVPLSDAEEAGEGLRLALDVGRILTTVGASPRRVEVATTVQYLGPVLQGRLLVLGYPAASVGPDGPRGRPLVRWSSPRVERAAGEQHILRLPVEPPLWLMAGVDADLDGDLEPGDAISRPVERFDARAQRSLVLQIDGALAR